MIEATTIPFWLVSVVVTCGSWIKLFSEAEKHVSPITKRRVRRWFLHLPEDNDVGPSNWADGFIVIFDRVFGDRILSWKFFLRSCMATTLFLVVIALAFVGYGQITRDSIVKFHMAVGGSASEAALWIAIIVVGNFLADYVSLAETRAVLSLIKNRSKLVQFLGVLFDACLTGFIFLMIARSLFGVEQVFVGRAEFSDYISNLLRMWREVILSLNFSYYGDIQDLIARRGLYWGSFYSDAYRIALITTYLTSIWIWLFVLSGGFGRVFFVLRGAVTRFGRLFDVAEYPVTAIGYTLALITFILHVGIYAGVALTQNFGTPAAAERPDATASVPDATTSIPADPDGDTEVKWGQSETDERFPAIEEQVPIIEDPVPLNKPLVAPPEPEPG